MCAHCEKRVKQALEGVDGVLEAIPDHTAGKVTVRHDVPLDGEAIRAAVSEAGYEYLGPESER